MDVRFWVLWPIDIKTVKTLWKAEVLAPLSCELLETIRIAKLKLLYTIYLIQSFRFNLYFMVHQKYYSINIPIGIAINSKAIKTWEVNFGFSHHPLLHVIATYVGMDHKIRKDFTNRIGYIPSDRFEDNFCNQRNELPPQATLFMPLLNWDNSQKKNEHEDILKIFIALM